MSRLGARSPKGRGRTRRSGRAGRCWGTARSSERDYGAADRDWEPTTLGSVVDLLSGGTPSKRRADYWNGTFPWVSAKDMKQFRLPDTEDHLTEEGVANGTRIAPRGSVLLLTRGMTLLNDIPVCVIQRPMAFNQDVKGA